MARIRTIKPEFPESESMGRVSREARFLFIMLWLACDDEGKTRGHSRKLASTLYPYDEDAPKLIDGWLGELERENVVIRYQVDGATYLKVVAWAKHQKIDKPSKSRLPDPQGDGDKQPIREPSRTFSNPPEGHAKSPDTVAEASRDFDGHSRLYLGPRTIDSEAKASEPVGSRPESVFDFVPEQKPEPQPVTPAATTALSLEAQVWSLGKAYLIESGVSPAQAGGLIGRWRKQLGNDDLEVMRLLRRAQTECVSEPKAFIEGCIKHLKGTSNGKANSRQFGPRVIDDNPRGNFAALNARITGAGKPGRTVFDA